LFTSGAKIKLNLIPYKGAIQSVQDALAGNIQVCFGNVLNYMPLAKAGRLRMIAVTSAKRSSVLPQVPSIAEQGVPGYDVTTWHGWLAPAGTPPAIITKLSEELARAVKSPDVATRLAEDGGEPNGTTPEEFRQVIKTEVPRWRKIVKDLGLTSME
jgi:tripartite-type tricarboxylate transporter receptor subunit TctC